MRHKLTIFFVSLFILSALMLPIQAHAASGLNDAQVKQVINAVKGELSAVTYDSDEVAEKLAPKRFSAVETLNKQREIAEKEGRPIGSVTRDEAIAALQKEYAESAGYKESFADVQANLEKYLTEVVTSDSQVNPTRTPEQYTDLLTKDKVALLLGLTYEQRLYDFDYETTNFARGLRTSSSFGKAFSPLALAVTIGNSGGDRYAMPKNVEMFTKVIAPAVTDATTLDAFIRSVVTDDVSNWYVEQMQAHGNVVSENASAEIPDGAYRLYDKLVGSTKLQPYLLPLLTKENNSIFVLSNVASVSWGMQEGYVEDLSNAAEMNGLRQKVTAYGKNQADYIDFWARMAPTQKNALKADRIVTDGYRIASKGAGKQAWSPASGDQAAEAVRDFFGPMKRWSDYKFVGAEASGPDVTFWTARLLEPTGHSGYTHEITHQLAQNSPYPYLNGQTVRSGTSTELYPRGLYETYEKDDPIYTLNQIMDLPEGSYANSSVNNFTDEESVRSYMSNLLDVTNTLDLVEAQEVLKRGNDVKQKWFNVVTMKKNTSGTYDEVFAASTAQDAASWKSIDDLVDANAVVSRYEAVGTQNTGTAQYNGYHVVPLFSPLYGAPLTPSGNTGDIHMRRIAWELMGEYGFTKGWVPYLSDQYRPAATADKAAFADAEVLKKISNYSSDAEFRKAMYAKRAARLDELKDVTITWNGKQETVSDEQTLRRLMSEAIDADLANGTAGKRAVETSVEKLKSALYLAYKTKTNEFKETVYEASEPEKTFSLTYQFDGDVPADVQTPVDSKTYRVGETVTLAVPTTTATANADGAEGTWAFNGWKVSGQGETVTSVTITDGDVTLVGSWTFTAKPKPEPQPEPDPTPDPKPEPKPDPEPKPEPKQNEVNEPAWTAFEVEAGSTATGTAPVDSLGKDGFPAGTTFTWVPTPQYDQVRPWISVDPATGIITATPPADVALGSYTVRIDVIYPDDSFDTVNTSVSVQAAPKPTPKPDPDPDPTPDLTPDPVPDPTPNPVPDASDAPDQDTDSNPSNGKDLPDGERKKVHTSKNRKKSTLPATADSMLLSHGLQAMFLTSTLFLTAGFAYKRKR
ncbi:MAG: hypothetical protein E7001_08315 [Coriobacteriaceae bacterium]|nr:hypothetical protein [Coriobacteriaceae bacterium]